MGWSHDHVRCPMCGQGVLVNVAYEDRVMGASRLRQDPEAREIRRYSCGHEWVGSALVSADTRRLTVEERSSEETVDPVDQEIEDDDEP